MPVICDYCQQPAQLVTGEDLYPHRPDLHAKRMYRCTPCQAWVGCHPGTERPLGRLANAELRAAKQRAHAAIDPVWKELGHTRGQAYRMLRQRMGMTKREAHIGKFDVAQCDRVVELFKGAQA